MQKKSFSHYFGISLRGIGMGAADVVPGVSGGTIAFITGIYEELISSLSNLNLKALKVLKNEGISSFWNHINGSFFLSLFIGIFISILSLAKVVTHLLEHYPVLLWSFFFGLVLASALLVIKSVNKWNIGTIIFLLVGVGIAAWISSLQVIGEGASLGYIFLSGAIAICAMILPGISGAFILVLLGSYSTVMTGIKEFDLKLMAVFGVGCLVGLLAFSKLLNYLFKHFKETVLALLAGFLIGSLVKIWPWKENVGEKPIIVHSDGREDFMQQNVLPSVVDGHFMWAVLLFVVGFLLIVFLGKLAPKNTKE